MADMPPIGMMTILQYARDAMHFDPWQGPGEKSFAFSVVSMALTLPASHLDLSDLNQTGKTR
jgi:hypothetical protein